MVAATEQKESVEKEVFELRYELAVQRAASVQLDRAIRDCTSAVSRLMDVRTSGHILDTFLEHFPKIFLRQTISEFQSSFLIRILERFLCVS